MHLMDRNKTSWLWGFPAEGSRRREHLKGVHHAGGGVDGGASRGDDGGGIFPKIEPKLPRQDGERLVRCRPTMQGGSHTPSGSFIDPAEAPVCLARADLEEQRTEEPERLTLIVV